MPFKADWLIPDQTGRTPADRWLGGLKALHVEAAQVINRIQVGALEDGTSLTPTQRQKLLDWFDDWLARLQQHATTPPA